MFEGLDFDNFTEPLAESLDPTPETGLTVVDGLQIWLVGIASFSAPMSMVMLARLVPPLIPATVVGLSGGAIALIAYGLLAGRGASAKSTVYGLLGLGGVIGGGWDYLSVLLSVSGMIGGVALILSLAMAGVGVAFVAKKVIRHG
ncbi:hypothetical protein SPB21_07610 [Leptothoe sp. ISB3NOV94-8A]|nr:hypothetical protein Lepto7375DRAFT_1794 [Leptolyngbya sp. PCC 7375]